MISSKSLQMADDELEKQSCQPVGVISELSDGLCHPFSANPVELLVSGREPSPLPMKLNLTSGGFTR